MEKLGTSFPPPIGSGTGLQTSIARQNYAVERARLLFGQYRKGDANDPETYVTAITAVLACYSEETIREATDPRSGISATEKFAAFMPNPGELKLYCDKLDRPSSIEAWAMDYERRSQQQLEDRAEREATGPRQLPQYMIDELIKKGLWKQDKGYTQQQRDADEDNLERYRQEAKP